MESKRMRYDVPCECGSRLSYDQTHNYKNYTTIYFDCRGCGMRFSIKYNEEGDEIDRKCVGKAKHNRDHKKVPIKPSTICWDCSNARGNGCSWFRSHTPVDGWTAQESEMYGSKSYTVSECPEFEKDAR